MPALKNELEGLRLGDVVGAEVIPWIGVATRNVAEAVVLQALQYIEGLCVSLRRIHGEVELCHAACIAARALVWLVTVRHCLRVATTNTRRHCCRRCKASEEAQNAHGSGRGTNRICGMAIPWASMTETFCALLAKHVPASFGVRQCYIFVYVGA